jgi:serine/threonine protein kinase
VACNGRGDAHPRGSRRQPPFTAIVAAVAQIAATLADLADEDIAHRDLKPSNLFAIDDRYLVGDFGLADFPGKAEITDNDHKLGAWGYIAPEMLNSPADADGAPADVYSLAKTLWVLATGHNFPLTGHQAADQVASRLSSQVADASARLLDPIVDLATRTEVSERPTMRQFADELRQWLTPPPPSTGPPSIDDLVARAADLTADERAHRERAQQVSDRMSDTAAAFGREMQPVFDAFVPLGAVAGGDPMRHRVPADSTFSRLMSTGARGSGSPTMFAFPPPASTWLHAGYGWAIPDDDYLLLFAVISLIDDTGNHEDLFVTQPTVIPDSAEAKHAIKQIADETSSQLPGAVERFVTEGERQLKR